MHINQTASFDPTTPLTMPTDSVLFWLICCSCVKFCAEAIAESKANAIGPSNIMTIKVHGRICDSKNQLRRKDVQQKVHYIHFNIGSGVVKRAGDTPQSHQRVSRA